MAKLTIRQKNEIRGALRKLKEAHSYIHREDVVVARKSNSPNGFSFKNKQGEALDLVETSCGSELVYLDDVISSMSTFLEDHSK